MATKALQSGAVPLFERVKSHVLGRVAAGELRTHDRVPSENELVRELGVSRMTVNRALKDLTAEGVLVRTPGVGTFVAPSRPQAHPLQIRNIADEITARSHEHRATLVSSETVTAGAEQAQELQCARRSRLYHIRLVHFENDVSVQYEDRFVNPVVAPDFLAEDYGRITPHEYLMRVAPLQRAEHVLRAALPPAEVAAALEMDEGEPCLLLLRRTWSSGIVASSVRLFYPASRYEFAGETV